MKPNVSSTVVLIGLCVCAGCTSSGGGAGATATLPATALVKTWYDAPANTLVHEEGLVLVGPDGKPTDIRHGPWKTYFPPQDGNGLQFEKNFAHGSWDEEQAWMEYNADSSIRDTVYDGLW